MGAAEKIEVGDYDLRGPDFETILVGPVSELTIDADRRVRRRFSNGFPNWAMYRTVYAGDSNLRGPLRSWCVAYAIAYCEAGGVRKGQPADEIGCLAGWDAFYALLNHRWVVAGMDIADIAGVDPKTYRKVRNHVYAAHLASLKEYWDLLNIEAREVARDYRRWAAPVPTIRINAGRGFGDSEDLTGSGTFRAMPRGSGC